MTYLKKVFIGFDQLINTILNGWPDETLSARCHRMKSHGRELPANILNTLIFWQKDHCHSAFMNELQRKQLPQDYTSPR